MKRIYTGFAADPSPQQPLTTKSLDFLQDGNKEMIQSLCRNIITNHKLTYSATVPYKISAVDMPFISDGAIYFNGELYIMRENVVSALYAIVDATADTVADPLLFNDSVNRNVHNTRYLTFTNTLAGSLFTIANIVNVSIPIATPVWTSFTPTIVAYDSGGLVVTNGVTGTINGYYKIIDSNFYLILSSINFSTLVNVRSFIVTNIATLLNLVAPQLAIGGGSFAISPLTCKSEISLLYSGAGDPFRISINDNINFGVTTNLTFRYSTLIAITG